MSLSVKSKCYYDQSFCCFFYKKIYSAAYHAYAVIGNLEHMLKETKSVKSASMPVIQKRKGNKRESKNGYNLCICEKELFNVLSNEEMKL